MRVSELESPASAGGGVGVGADNGGRVLRSPQGVGGAARVGVALETFEVGTQVSGGLVAEGAVLLQRLVDDVLELDRHVRVQTHRGGGGAVQDTVEDSGGGAAGEGLAARRHFVEHHAEGKDVGAGVHFFT